LGVVDDPRVSRKAALFLFFEFACPTKERAGLRFVAMKKTRAKALICLHTFSSLQPLGQVHFAFFLFRTQFGGFRIDFWEEEAYMTAKRVKKAESFMTLSCFGPSHMVGRPPLLSQLPAILSRGLPSHQEQSWQSTPTSLHPSACRKRNKLEVCGYVYTQTGGNDTQSRYDTTA